MKQRLCLPLLAAALLLVAAAGCSSDDDEPLPGAYRSTEFRLQTDSGDVVDVGADGGRLEMALDEDGSLQNGRLTVPGEVCALLVRAGCEASGPTTVTGLTGRYTRDGDALTFDLDGSDTFLEDVGWIYDGTNGEIRAETVLTDHGVRDYVLFLEKRADDG